MSSSPLVRCAVLADFNPANFVALLGKDAADPGITARAAEFGPIDVTAAQLATFDSRPDAAIVWTRADNAIPAFGRLLRFERVSTEELIGEVDRYCDQVVRLRDHADLVIAASWALPPGHRGAGVLDMTPGVGSAYALARMNARLAERLAGEPSILVLNADRWTRDAKDRHSAKLWYLAKVPFSNGVFDLAVEDVKAAVRAVRGRSRKLLVLDLDDTLWGGIVGDVGWQSLRLGGHDALGEAFLDFQRRLKALARRGVVLALVSKNEESVALQAIREHPEMLLREDDFAAWRINWNDKAANIADMVAGLELSLDATVFIDDSAIERERVRSALPDVCVPEWPRDPMLYAQALGQLPWFDTAALTSDDALRAASYTANRAREELRTAVGSEDEWRKSLDVVIDVRPFSVADLPRIAQLLNKTNQMNLSTRRLSEAALLEWVSEGERRFWTFRLQDRFGDYGLVGLLSVEHQGEAVRVIDFVLSCRAFGREVEGTMVALAVDHARATGAKAVVLRLARTARNAPCLRFLAASPLTESAPDEFTWEVAAHYPVPAAVTIVRAGVSELAG